MDITKGEMVKFAIATTIAFSLMFLFDMVGLLRDGHNYA